MKRLMAAAALALAVSSIGVGASAAATIETSEPMWEECFLPRSPFECATVAVPLDHDRPHGATIDVALARLPATGEKLGSIFLNPGGPGGSGVEFVIGAGPVLFTPEVREHFDLVGFDPRGIRRSNPLRCFTSVRRAASTLAPFAFPFTPEEELVKEEADQALAEACDRRVIRIKNHMSTADVARDLDLLRAAVGDDQLRFAGYSYGSFLGVVYANLFPDKVGAVVVDGVLDPIAWTTGRQGEENVPFSTRIRSDAGAQDTLDEFLRLCDEAGAGECALSGDASGRFDALADRLRDGPIEVVDPRTGAVTTFTYADLISTVLGSLYQSAGWSDLADLLADIEASADPATLGEALDAVWTEIGFPTMRTPYYRNYVEGQLGVACTDSDNPDDHAAWSAAGAAADAEFGYFGRIWAWFSSPCAVWPGVAGDRFVGPFDSPTRHPVLVVGTRFDPATRYEGAELVDALLPDSGLLTVEGWGHTSLFLSRCADEVVSEYLLSGSLPAPGTACAQDVAPFDTPSGADRNELELRRETREKIMREVAVFPFG